MVTLASVPVLVSVHAEMNDRGMVTVELYKTNETHHLVTYEPERVRDAPASFSEGARVPVRVVRTGSHPDVWRAVALHNRRTLPANQSVHTTN